LQAGAVFKGSIRLRKKTGTSWITIQTSAMASLPPAGTRVTPADRIHMPKLVADLPYPVFKAEQGAHHYRIIGVEMAPAAGLYVWQLVELGFGNETSIAQLPHYIELDRVYIHGDPNVGGKRGISLNSRHTTIKNSWISGFKSTNQDTQAIAGWNGPGPFTIENNYLEASAESLVFGGAKPAIQNLVPSDITIRRNHLYKPLSWRGTSWWVKNSFELKNARRVLFEGNVVENIWEQQQSGFAVQLTVRTENGTVPWAVVEHVNIQYNIFRHCASGITITGADSNGLGVSRNITIRHNLFEDIDSVKWGGTGRLFQVLKGVDYVVIDHNTGFHNGQIIVFEGGTSDGLIYRNNVSAHNASGIFGSGTAAGTSTLARYAPGAVVTRNVLAGGNAALYPAGNYFPPSLSAVGFVDIFRHDYRLSPSSPYYRKGTDGKDLGVDIIALNAMTAGVDRN
jgi:hypothetical protein